MHLKRALFPLLLFGWVSVFLLGYGWIAWNAFDAIRESMTYEPYPGPYRAKIVEINHRTVGRSTTVAPVVEVTDREHRTFRFTSTRRTMISFLSPGDTVSLVHRTGRNILGLPADQIEIDNAYHLWIESVLWALLFPGVVVSAFLWQRIRPIPARLKFWPVSRLRRPHA